MGNNVKFSEAQEVRRTNHLAGQKSPYLLQHQHNPVDWRPWGEEAFDKARADGKPILLSVGYSTCRWCHVMERESFENPENRPPTYAWARRAGLPSPRRTRSAICFKAVARLENMGRRR